jgi:hypothetical protein
MLEIEVDVFSGSRNPSWVINDETAQDVLREIVRSRGAVTDINKGFQGLGYRGFIIKFPSSDLARKYGLPQAFRVTGSASLNESRAGEIVERWRRGGRKSVEKWSGGSSVIRGEKALEGSSLFQDNDIRVEGSSVSQGDSLVQGLTSEHAVIPTATCYYDTTPYNPDFWNKPDVQPKNNCYNYATNRRTDTFAQPGEGSGSIYSAINCDQVAKAALRDGAHKRYDCFPSSEYPRYLIALVIAPKSPFIDFHWYRLQKEGFWGHKPGSTAARNIDNKGKVIKDPENCDRGPYTIFCGYFYTAKSMNVK